MAACSPASVRAKREGASHTSEKTARSLPVPFSQAIRVMSGIQYSGDSIMRDLFRTLIAGWGAKKAGLGCFGTIVVFILIYWLLGKMF